MFLSFRVMVHYNLYYSDSKRQSPLSVDPKVSTVHTSVIGLTSSQTVEITYSGIQKKQGEYVFFLAIEQEFVLSHVEVGYNGSVFAVELNVPENKYERS